MLRQNSKLISDVIDDYIRECSLNEGLQRARVFEAWDLLMAQKASPCYTMEEARRLTVAKYFKDGELSCRMGSSVVRTQLKFETESLKASLNSLLQDDIVKQIKIS